MSVVKTWRDSLQTKTFSFTDLPEIYQIEATNACQLKCKMCARELMKREEGYLNPALVEEMAERGDFANSYYVELQMYGEPLLHPDLSKIIEILKEKTDVKVGFSTNGLLLKKKAVDLLNCDFVTISLDADNPKTYSLIRGGDYDKLTSSLDYFLKIVERPVVDIQLIDLPQNKDQLYTIQEKYKDIPKVIVRSVPDCNVNLFAQTNAYPNTHELCLNPWLSVSIFWDGTVMPCCFAYDMYWDDAKKEEFVYGNLYTEPLSKIWQSELVKEFRKLHLKNQLLERCRHCLMRSPALLHFRMVQTWLKEL